MEVIWCRNSTSVGRHIVEIHPCRPGFGAKTALKHAYLGWSMQIWSCILAPCHALTCQCNQSYYCKSILHQRSVGGHLVEMDVIWCRNSTSVGRRIVEIHPCRPGFGVKTALKQALFGMVNANLVMHPCTMPCPDMSMQIYTTST